MKIALLMNDNNYAGREYLHSLYKRGIDVDVICLGENGDFSQLENERCGELWNPTTQEELEGLFLFHRFQSLKSESLRNFLLKTQYNLGIQGGVGILKNSIIELFEYGILNFHPGDLPLYRGCSAPEWQLYEGKVLVSTCHLIDEGIDTGKIVSKRVLNVDYRSYNHYRASVYPETADFVSDIIGTGANIDKLICSAYDQNNAEARYREYIGEEKIAELKLLLERP